MARLKIDRATRLRNHRERNYQKAYGISIADFDKMSEAQQHICAVCGRSEWGINPRSKKIMPLSVDHNHTTGKVRGLLCRRCNGQVGFIEGPNYHSALEYLNKYAS